MKKIILIVIILFQVNVMFADAGDKLMRQQKRQESTIRSAYKRNKITENEYRKLMDEQRTIKRYIKLAEADNYWNRAEIQRVDGKLQRAENRLRRYKTNWED